MWDVVGKLEGGPRGRPFGLSGELLPGVSTPHSQGRPQVPMLSCTGVRGRFRGQGRAVSPSWSESPRLFPQAPPASQVTGQEGARSECSCRTQQRKGCPHLSSSEGGLARAGGRRGAGPARPLPSLQSPVWPPQCERECGGGYPGVGSSSRAHYRPAAARLASTLLHLQNGFRIKLRIVFEHLLCARPGPLVETRDEGGSPAR